MGEAVSVRFIDGPADGVRMSFQREVYFLRVVRDPAGKWDALDQPDDTPSDNEVIVVYHHVKTDGVAFVDGRDPKTGKRFGRVENSMVYMLHPIQPTDSEMRDNDKWRAWCFAQPEAERYKPKPPAPPSQNPPQ